MTAYSLTDPIPDIQDITAIDESPISEGVSSRVMLSGWKDGSDHSHILVVFGGFTDENWNAHYINTFNGDHAIITDVAQGAGWAGCHDPISGKVYILTNYGAGSFTEFDPSNYQTTVISSNCGNAGQCVVGSDGKIYLHTSGGAANRVYSYDPAVGISSWRSYGTLPDTNGEQTSISGIGEQAGRVFASARKTNGSYSMWSCALNDTNWTEWEFGADTYVMVWIDVSTSSWRVFRRIVGGARATYDLTGTAPYYTYVSATEFDIPTLINAPCYMYRYGELVDNQGFYSQVGYDLDSTDFSPIKDIHEYSKLGYAVHDSESWVFSDLPFTGPWTPQTTREILPYSGTTVFALSQDYNTAFALDYNARSRTYIGAEIIAPYILKKHPTSGEYYAGGYSNFVWRFVPTLDPDEWTLTMANTSPIDTGGTPGQDGRPNPYRIDLPGTIYHYRHGIDFDANGLVWIGGNTTRLETDYGNVGWYNPSDGTNGYLYDWTSGILFRSICSCLNGSKILVFSNDNILHRIDADNKTDDSVDITNTGGYGYMVETSYDRVFVVHFSAGPTYKVGILKPSDMTWVVALSATPLSGLGVPFGFAESLYLRMYRKLELGPDGFVWMQVGTTIYRIDPTQDPLVFEDIADVGTSASLKFAANNTDLILYNLNANPDGGDTDVKYIYRILTFEGYSKGAYSSLPGNDDDLLNIYTDEQITDIAADDTDMVGQLATSQIAIHQFKREIAGTGGIIDSVAQVTIPCSTSTTYLQIYNRSGTPAWETIDSDNATGANTDFTLSATVADLTDYKDENNIVACRVYQEMQ